MNIPGLIDALEAALNAAGCTTPRRGCAPFERATDAVLEALAAEAGCELTGDLEAWFRHVSSALVLLGNYETISAVSALEKLRSLKEIDFSRHDQNVKGWADGRYDSGQLADTYWQAGWVPVARDGCGNTYCVDLAPGPHGARGQLIAMEFQDGQGPYLAHWATLESMLLDHLSVLAEGRYFVDDEGFIEYD